MLRSIQELTNYCNIFLKMSSTFLLRNSSIPVKQFFYIFSRKCLRQLTLRNTKNCSKLFEYNSKSKVLTISNILNIVNNIESCSRTITQLKHFCRMSNITAKISTLFYWISLDNFLKGFSTTT